MIVRVYNFLSEEKPKFSQNLVGIVSDVTNFKYTRRAYDIGSFEMTIPTHADETECIQPDRMLIVGEKIKQTYIDGDPTKRIVVGTFLYVTDVEKKDDTITVTGYDLKYLFALRVTLFSKEEQDKGTYGYYVTSGTTFSCISDIINYNIVNTTDSDRQIYGMFGITMPVNQINADPPLTGIQDDRYMTRLEPVSTAIFNLLKNCKTHFYDMRLIIDDNAEDGDSYNPHMESSEDKPTIIIDESRYNIKSYTRKDGTSAYKNAIYAVVGSGDAVTVKCVKRPDDTASGVKRKEVVLDVDTDSVAEIDRYALKAAEEYVISDDFEIEPLFMDDETEPELAQKVSIRIDGVEYETVITEITDEYANGKHTQSYVCGDKKLKVLNVLNKATAGNTQKIVNNKIATGNKPTGVGMYTNEAKNSEVFNDYGRNTASGNYSHVEGYKNNLKSEGATRSWATHIEGQENTEASRTSCPSDKKASNNHIEGKLNSSYGRFNHVEGVNCFAEYDTQCCHVEGSNSRVSEGAKVAHAEGKDCVAGGNCTHAQNLGTIAEKDNCTALGKYNKDFDYAVMIGGGSSDADRKNILTVEWDGTVRNTGSVYTDGDVMGKNGVFDGNLSVLGNVNLYGKTNFKVPIATKNTVGGIKIGNNLSIAADGTLSAEAQPDIASASKAGIVKVGENIDVTADGTISIPAPCTLRIDNKASANLVHKYVPVTASEEKIYYGDIDNSIICNGYTFWRNGMTFSDQGIFVDFSPTLMIKKFAKTASGEIVEDCDFQVALVNVDSSIYAYKSYRLESKKAGLTTTSTYKHYSVQFDPIIFPTWKSIIAPTSEHPYGRIQVTLSLMYVNSSNKVTTGNSISGYIDFATEAEYNAAVCLTHSSVRTTRIEERTNAFIIPSSLSLVTDALPETGEEDVLYLVYDKDTAPAMKEYLWHNGAWRYLGTTDVDLSEYMKSTDISDWAKAENKPAYTAEEIGLGNVDNTADADKPISSAMQTALDGKADVSHKHTISDITDMPASLPANGGNADTVDGKHASDFAVAGHTHTAADVGAATAADITAAVNAVSIGGRNLLPNTNDMSQWNVLSSAVRIDTDSEGYSEGVFYGDNTAWAYLTSKPNILYSKIRNKQITISFEYRAEEQWTSSVRAFACSLDLKLTDNALNRVKYSDTVIPKGNYVAPTTQWHRFFVTVNVSDSIFISGSGTVDFDNVFCSLGIYRNNTCHLHFRKFKMEIGNKPTDWSPAPEDAERRITSLEARVAALEAAAVSGGEV